MFQLEISGVQMNLRLSRATSSDLMFSWYKISSSSWKDYPVPQLFALRHISKVWCIRSPAGSASFACNLLDHHALLNNILSFYQNFLLNPEIFQPKYFWDNCCIRRYVHICCQNFLLIFEWFRPWHFSNIHCIRGTVHQRVMSRHLLLCHVLLMENLAIPA